MEIKHCYVCQKEIPREEALDGMHFTIDQDAGTETGTEFNSHLVEKYNLIKCSGRYTEFLNLEDIKVFAEAVMCDPEDFSHWEDSVVVCMTCAYSAARDLDGPMEVFGYPKLEEEYQKNKK